MSSQQHASFMDFADRIGAIAGIVNTKAEASRQLSIPKSHYADSILSKPITDYVRDAEIVESRLFTVSQASLAGEISSTVDLKRREAVSATPLKKVRESPLTVLDPEEYLRSVLRLTEK
jgi:hypothetical protein